MELVASSHSGSGVLCWLGLTMFHLECRAGYLLLLIERAKKCLDFSVTMYIIHLIFCSMYAGFPATVTWWVVNLICCVTTALIGEWLCMRREMKDIPIRSTRLGIFNKPFPSRFNSPICCHVQNLCWILDDEVLDFAPSPWTFFLQDYAIGRQCYWMSCSPVQYFLSLPNEILARVIIWRKSRGRQVKS